MAMRTDESDDFPEMLTVAEVAELFRVCSKTVHRCKDEYGMPFNKFGGTLRFEKKRVMDWARNNATEFNLRRS